MTYSKYKAGAGDLFELLRRRNLSCQLWMQGATLVWKSLHVLSSEYFRSNFEKLEIVYKGLWKRMKS